MSSGILSEIPLMISPWISFGHLGSCSKDYSQIIREFHRDFFRDLPRAEWRLPLIHSKIPWNFFQDFFINSCGILLLISSLIPPEISLYNHNIEEFVTTGFSRLISVIRSGIPSVISPGIPLGIFQGVPSVILSDIFIDIHLRILLEI